MRKSVRLVDGHQADRLPHAVKYPARLIVGDQRLQK
jgi:hypothetical protein